MKPRRVRPVKGGPVLIDGPVEVEMPDGSVVSSDRFVVALCVCRRSLTYPLCDTSHRRQCRVVAATSNDGERE
ncbi:CDGSH iron-sulfur domain-containing protein [Aldersonia kunmingensis]|uniref:CDGSH iron-sulfur domain-containing protein n=1 Tax=Aldersonia kunmingensis TaxID=408066 RepID=UPI003CCC2A67